MDRQILLRYVMFIRTQSTRGIVRRFVNRLKTQALMWASPDDYHHWYCVLVCEIPGGYGTKISAVKNRYR